MDRPPTPAGMLLRRPRGQARPRSVGITRREFLKLMAGATFAVAAPPPDRWREVVSFLEAERAEGTIPGAALIASRGGRVLFEHALGSYYSLRDREAPLGLAAIHPLYSYSKLISATVVAMARQEGRIDYDAPVCRIAPEFATEGKEKITLRHLLSHSAGIPSVPIPATLTEEQWQAAWGTVCRAKLEWEPGSRTAYHGGSGLFVAAEVVRRAWGRQPWAGICRERLFAPIGAETLTFGLPPEDAPVAVTPRPKERPAGMRAAFGFAGHPAGGCFGAPADALKVLQLHLNGGTWDGKRLITREALAELHTVQYRKQIEQAAAEGRPPAHESWGLGILLRGAGPKAGGHQWFGFADQASPGVFGHAGINTVIGVADPATGGALFFASTDSPPSNEKTVDLRNGVTNRVLAALG